MHQKTVALVAALVFAAVVPFGAVGAPASDATETAVSPASTTLATQEDCAFPVTRTDGTGTEVTLEEPPERIVAIGGSTPQVMWELGVQDRVVGMPVQSYTAYLNGSENKTDVVTQDGAVDQEQVVALQPDLVVLANIYSNETAQSLRAAGLTVYKEDFPSTLAGITRSVDTYGALTGACDQAEQTNEQFDASIDAIDADAETFDSPRVFYYFFNFTAGSGTFTDELITTAGGTNVAAEAGVTGFRQVNLEIVAEQDPEVVVVPSDSSVPTGEPWNSTTAYQEGNIVRVDTNLAQQPAPRVIGPIRTMQEAFAAAAQSTPTPEQTTVAATTAPPTDATFTTTAPAEDDDQQTPAADSSGDGAGFGLASALVALAAAALLATRRR
ncbi:PGF-CTERM-anchored ABC transporter substrate-binding protein [Salinirubellus salinus]|uniref:PGF-CTERM-anchored ABC transporter substrate-binding protein n=1 Tax=Salinirubellus salinus TaxID=1364945 RepID=A0A9E7U8R9_9EURY|nr:PGF-CTERM-anchored ABC transporter substrate-binding protein [Salinirubellus salinus]UWM55126.1 PGF-CTERM-anchored ABC transporter substrate-binding protein [Salinirubellus salinus]